MTPAEFTAIGQELVGSRGDWQGRLSELLSNLLSPEDTDADDPVHRRPPQIDHQRIADYAAGGREVPAALAALLRRPRHPQFRPVVFRVDDYRLSDVPDEEKAAMRAHPFRVIEDDGAAATVVAWFNRRDRGVAEDVARFLQRRNNRVGQAALPAARPDDPGDPVADLKIDASVMPPGPARGGHRDADGRPKHGIYRQRQDTLVVAGTPVAHRAGFERVTIYVRGFTDRWYYTYPIIPRQFQSPQHRWENLHFVGGWEFEDAGPAAEDFGWNGHLDAVLRGRKPLASYSIRAGANGDRDRVLFDRAAQAGLRCRRAGSDDGGENFLVWADDRPIDRIFNLDALIADHLAWLDIAQRNDLVRGFTADDIRAAFDRLRGIGYADLPSDLPDLHWDGIDTILLTGLIYGYPPASTAASLFFAG